MTAPASDFVLPVDKPEGPTSHDVVARARRALGIRRVGHTGTLDPFASGLLVLCMGRATRIAEYLSALDKTYEAIVRLGIVTDTLDREGAVVEERTGWERLGEDDLVGALRGLEGSIDQVPPQFSAKKVGGEPMHRKARRGERVALGPERVEVHELTVVGVDLPLLALRVRCSSGTYVRALARDLGETLGVGAHLTELRRTAVGSLAVERAVPAGALDDAARVHAAKLSPLDALAHLPAVEIGDIDARRLGQGQAVVGDAEAGGRHDAPPPADDAHRPAALPVRVVHGGALFAVAELREGRLHPRKVFLG